MATIPIWPGSAKFSASKASTDVKPTPYGFYDDDDIFLIIHFLILLY